MRTLLSCLVAAIAATVANAQDIANGKTVYEWICAACHGPEAEGQKALQAPSLRMQQDWYLQGELEKFRAGIRGAHKADVTGAPMQLTATALDDAQVVDVIAYVVSLGAKGLPPSQHSLSGDAEHGATLYATCAGCHGADGRGNPALRAPGLAGQWDWYIARQLGKFRGGIRGGDARDAYGAQMAPFAALLADDAAVRDVATYIRTLEPPAAEATPAPDLQNGEKTFAICAVCHGEHGQGNAVSNAPHLAAQSTWYVARQLLNFRRGVRGSDHGSAFGMQMRSIVGNFDDQTVLDLAGHVASLAPPARREPTAGFGGDLAQGQRIFRKTCSPCHGQDGQGNRVLSAPALAGQEDRYVLRQLQDFRAGVRGADRRDPSGRIMRAWAGSLKDDAEVRSVAAYVASLPPQRADGLAFATAGERSKPRRSATTGESSVAVVPTTGPMPRGMLSPGNAEREARGGGAGAGPNAAAPPTAGVAPLTTTLPAAEAEAAAPSPGTAVADVTRAPAATTPGELIYATCLGCHGAAGQGNATLHAPALAGLRDWYVTDQLQKFRTGVRGAHPLDANGPSMRMMATTLADDQAVLDVAHFVASLAVEAPPAPTLGGDAAAGAALYVACASCHGPDARGNPTLKAPSLADQADWYLATQLRNFKSGARGSHPLDTTGALMRPMAMALADDTAVANVVAHISKLSRGDGAAAPATAATTTTAPAVPAAPTTTMPAPAAAAAPTEAAPAGSGDAAASGADDNSDDSGDGEETETAAAEPKADAAHGKTLFTTCVACHGADGAGNPTLKSPALASQEPWYLATQLRNFKAGVRGTDPSDVTGAQMRPMAMTLADEQAILDVAAYASSLPFVTAGAPTLAGDAARGKNIFVTCSTCHGPDARGLAPLKAPALAGQADWYVAAQLRNFRSGARGTNPQDATGMLMRPMAMALADEQAILDVAAYVASLPRK